MINHEDDMAVGTAGQVKRLTCRLDIALSTLGGLHQPLADSRTAQGLTTVANTFCTTSHRPSVLSKLR